MHEKAARTIVSMSVTCASFSIAFISAFTFEKPLQLGYNPESMGGGNAQ
jgi:hypothetical protein